LVTKKNVKIEIDFSINYIYITIPTKYSIVKIIPITKRIEPIIYINRAGSEGRIRFKNIKIIPIIINAIPVSNDTILFYYNY
jgi:hypothetical protein